MRLFLIPVLLSSVVAASACSEAQEYEAKVGVKTESARDTHETPRTVDAEPGALKLENERIEFSYTWPAAANAIPALAARFEREAQSALDEAQAMAAEDQAAARGDGPDSSATTRSCRLKRSSSTPSTFADRTTAPVATSTSRPVIRITPPSRW